MNRTNEPRGPRRGGEKGASFLNWSHWDPQGSPCRTHWNTPKKSHPVDLTKEKKDWLRGEKQTGGVGAEKKMKGIWKGGFILSGWFQADVGCALSSSRCNMMCSTNQRQPWLHSVQVLAAEILDHFMLARDQSVDQAGVVIQHVRASEEPALSEQPRDPPQPARLSTHSHSPTRILKIPTKWAAVEQTPFQKRRFSNCLLFHYAILESEVR